MSVDDHMWRFLSRRCASSTQAWRRVHASSYCCRRSNTADKRVFPAASTRVACRSHFWSPGVDMPVRSLRDLRSGKQSCHGASYHYTAPVVSTQSTSTSATDVKEGAPPSRASRAAEERLQESARLAVPLLPLQERHEHRRELGVDPCRVKARQKQRRRVGIGRNLGSG